MRYVILVYDTRDYAADDLAASGELIVSEILADPSQGVRVTAERLAGFLLVDCDSLDRAVEIAARVPDAEVRPVLTRGGLEF
ncbi:MAG TPA: YciI family protein [Micromonosporaceae bacterium]|nr:YciI family protein [Micromonosporaceae bacterium]